MTASSLQDRSSLAVRRRAPDDPQDSVMRFRIDGTEVAVTGPGLLQGWLQVALPGWAGMTTIGMLYRRGSQWFVGSQEFPDAEQACRHVLEQHRQRTSDAPRRSPVLPVLAVTTALGLLYLLLSR